MNCVARELDRLPKGSIQNVWIDEHPDVIRPLLISDVSHVTLISHE
jgi:hypothetical protein